MKNNHENYLGFLEDKTNGAVMTLFELLYFTQFSRETFEDQVKLKREEKGEIYLWNFLQRIKAKVQGWASFIAELFRKLHELL